MKGSIEMGNNNKNKYDEEFKANAVRLVTGGTTDCRVRGRKQKVKKRISRHKRGG